MNTLILLTIIVDDSLQKIVEEEILALGAKGYTTLRVEGNGKSGSRDNIWSGENVKIETIVNEKTVTLIIQRLKAFYFEKYPIITYYHQVNVLRTSHFS